MESSVSLIDWTELSLSLEPEEATHDLPRQQCLGRALLSPHFQFVGHHSQRTATRKHVPDLQPLAFSASHANLTSVRHRQKHRHASNPPDGAHDHRRRLARYGQREQPKPQDGQPPPRPASSVDKLSLTDRWHSRRTTTPPSSSGRARTPVRGYDKIVTNTTVHHSSLGPGAVDSQRGDAHDSHFCLLECHVKAQ